MSGRCWRHFSHDEPERFTGALLSLPGARASMANDPSRERRRRASQCLELARQTDELNARASLLAIAQKWLDLAEASEHNAWNEALRARAIQAAIGREVAVMYPPPQDLPERLFDLLRRLDRPREQGRS